MKGWQWTWWLLVSGLVHSGDLLVVTAEATAVDQVTSFQVQQLYLGKLDRIDNTVLTPLNLREKDSLRHQFETLVFPAGFNLRNYWLTQRLLAEAKPPPTIASWSLMLVYLSRNPGYIGYVDARHEPSLVQYNLKVILRLPAPKS